MRHVVTLQVIVHVDLPVAGHLPAGAVMEFVAAQHALRPQSRVDAGDELVERRCCTGDDEDQSLPQLYAPFRQADRGRIEVRRTTHFRRAVQYAVEPVGPAVVAAAQHRRALAVATGDRPRAVAADVVERADRRLVAAHDQQRQARNRGHHVIAHAGQLRLMTDQLPARCEHRGGVEPGHARISVEARGKRQRVLQRLRREHVGREQVGRERIDHGGLPVGYMTGVLSADLSGG